MNLDEQIAFLQSEATEALSEAQETELYNLGSPALMDWAAARREHAATLLTIENTLRAVQLERFGAACEAAADKMVAEVESLAMQGMRDASA